MRSISFIIPIRNKEKSLKKLFGTLNGFSLPKTLRLEEVIFVDDGSIDRTFYKISQIASDYPSLNVSVISYKKRLGIRKAGLEGLKYAKSKFNIIVRDDLSNLNSKLKRIDRKIQKNKKTRPPVISVVMPVYNAEKYVGQAIRSILNQTLKNFEFIIVDDSSTDSTWDIIRKFAQKSKRIKLFRNDKRMGVSITVKRAIEHARGDFIARMDADDISFPGRFEKQLSYLRQNRKTVAVGAQCLLINKRGRIIGEKVFPTSFDKIYEYIYRFVPLQQPTLMIAKKRLPRDFEFYRDGMNSAEEVELIFKLFVYGKVENLNEFLFKYRMHDKNTSLSNVKETFFLTLLSRIKAVFAYGYKPSPLGIFITIAQTILVLLLPGKMILYLYIIARNRSLSRLPNPFLVFRALFQPA